MSEFDRSLLSPAKLMTPEEEVEWRSESDRLDRDIRDGLRSAREELWRVAEQLHGFRESQGWKAFGTKVEWLESPGIDLSEATFDRAARVWETFVVVQGIDPRDLSDLDMSKLDIARPALGRGEVTIRKLLADVRDLSARELTAKYVRRTSNVGGSERPVLAATGGPESFEPGTPALPGQIVVKHPYADSTAAEQSDTAPATVETIESPDVMSPAAPVTTAKPIKAQAKRVEKLLAATQPTGLHAIKPDAAVATDPEAAANWIKTLRCRSQQLSELADGLEVALRGEQS